MFPILNIGPLAIQTPLLLLLLGLWLGMSVGSRFSERFGVSSKSLDDLILISILAGLIGGRILFFVRFPGALLENPTSLLSLNPKLFLLTGALLVGGVAFLVLLQRKGLPIWNTLDALSLPLAIFFIFLGLSHLASGSVYGATTSVPWAIHLWSANRHPTQVYEILVSILVFILTWMRFQSLQINEVSNKEPGSLFLSFVSLLSLGWILIEPFRADSVYLVGNLRFIQVVAFTCLMASFWFMRSRTGQMTQAQGEIS